MKVFPFAGERSNQKHERAAAKHLLSGAEEWRGRVFRRARVKRTGRPDERREKQDRYPDGRMMVAFARKAQRGSEQNGDADKSAGEPEPNDSMRPRSHSEKPGEQSDVDRDGRDNQTRQTRFDKFFRKGHAAVAAEQQKRANDCRGP